MNFLRYFPKIFLVVSTLSLSACYFKKKDITPTKKQIAGTVILLNGTSSAGKTTLLKELKKIDDTLQVASFDELWGSYTKRNPTEELDALAKIARTDEKANQKLNQLVEVYMRKVFDSFYAQISEQALTSKNVIVDTVIEDVKEFDKFLYALGTIKLTTVLLYCPLDVTISRLRQRNLAGVETRDFRLPINQYKLLYKPQENPSEQVVDTISSKDIKHLLRADIDEYLKDPPEDLKAQVHLVAKELEVFYKDFIKHFKLDELEKVVIVPVRPYDLILRCEKKPQALAQELATFIMCTPRIFVSPEQPLIDQPVEIIVSNLEPNSQVILEASAHNKEGDTYKARATFQIDDRGIVNAAKQAPISGSYNGIDPMGLFWSLTSISKDPYKNTLQAQGTLDLRAVLLSVFSGDKLQAQKVINRVWPDVERKEICEQGIVGTLFYPESTKESPGLITIPGAGGIPDLGVAQILAYHGYTVLALAYFGQEGLPKNISLIPLEYFQNAMRWLKKQPQVEGNKIAIIGQSRGAELVLLLASLFPGEMDAGIAYSPSHLVYGDHLSEEKSAWTYKNKPVPFMPYEQEIFEAAKVGYMTQHKGTIEDPILLTQFYLYGMKKFSNSIKEATIPVENIRCPILILSGNDDKQYPSPVSGKSIIERLDSMGSKIKRKYVNYPNAGNHIFTFPYRPSIDLPFTIASGWTLAGGTPEGNAHAIEQAWAEVLNFLKETLGKAAGISAWQRSIDETFAAKKARCFEAKDKTGATIILEWQKTNVHEPEYAHIMRELADLFIRAFVPNEIRFLKAHPEAVVKAEKNDPYKQLAPLFKGRAESVDWKAVEEKMASIARSYWESQTAGEDVSKRYANSIFFFVIAKDAFTNNVLGFVCYRIDDDDPQGAVIIEPLAVAPEAQTRGLGKLLTASIFKLLPGVTRIGLTVESKNEIALKAYQAWGFVEFQAPDAYHKNMEYRAEKSDVLQKIARTLTGR